MEEAPELEPEPERRHSSKAIPEHTPFHDDVLVSATAAAAAAAAFGELS